jgi:hypothetical protein
MASMEQVQASKDEYIPIPPSAYSSNNVSHPLKRAPARVSKDSLRVKLGLLCPQSYSASFSSIYAVGSAESDLLQRPKSASSCAFYLAGVAANAAMSPISTVGRGAHLLLDAAIKETRDSENEAFVGRMSDMIRQSHLEGTDFVKDLARLAEAYENSVPCSAESIVNPISKSPSHLDIQQSHTYRPDDNRVANTINTSSDTTDSSTLANVLYASIGFVKGTTNYVLRESFNIGCSGVSLASGTISSVLSCSTDPIAMSLATSSLLTLPISLGYQATSASVSLISGCTWTLSQYVFGLDDPVKSLKNSLAQNSERAMHASVDNVCWVVGKSVKGMISFVTGIGAGG